MCSALYRDEVLEECPDLEETSRTKLDAVGLVVALSIKPCSWNKIFGPENKEIQLKSPECYIVLELWPDSDSDFVYSDPVAGVLQSVLD